MLGPAFCMGGTRCRPLSGRCGFLGQAAEDGSYDALNLSIDGLRAVEAHEPIAEQSGEPVYSRPEDERGSRAG